MLLCLDCGSTFYKAALFSPGLERLASHSVATPYTRNSGGFVEIGPEATLRGVQELFAGTCRKAGVSLSDVRRIAVTSQTQTFTILDERSEPLIPLLSWLDTRAAREAGELRATFGEGFHRHCSFHEVMPELQSSKLRWLGAHEAGVMKQCARVLTLPSFLAFKLGGLLAADSNHSAMNGLYSLAGRGWWDTMLDACGVNRSQLPPLMEIGTPLEAQRGLAGSGGTGLEWVLAGSDQTAAAFGNSCGPGRHVASLGTALVAYRFAGHSPGPFNAEGCWGPYAGGGYYELAVRNEGCLALDWAQEQVMPGGSVQAFSKAAEAAAPGLRTGWGVFAPSKMGKDSAWSHRAAAAGELAYQVLEGIAFSLRELIQDTLGCGDAGQTVCVTGGGARDHFWLQLIADVLGCRVERGMGDALLGAARMAGGEAGRAFDQGEGPIAYLPRADWQGRLAERRQLWEEYRDDPS